MVMLRASRRRAHDAAPKRHADGRIEANYCVREAGLQPIRVRLADHEARNRGRDTRSRAALEWIARRDEPDDAEQSTAAGDVEDLDREVANPAVDEHDP